MSATARPRFCRCRAVETPTMPAPSTRTSALRGPFKFHLRGLLRAIDRSGVGLSPLYDELAIDAPDRLCYSLASNTSPLTPACRELAAGQEGGRRVPGPGCRKLTRSRGLADTGRGGAALAFPCK